MSMDGNLAEGPTMPNLVQARNDLEGIMKMQTSVAMLGAAATTNRDPSGMGELVVVFGQPDMGINGGLALAILRELPLAVLLRVSSELDQIIVDVSEEEIAAATRQANRPV